MGWLSDDEPEPIEADEPAAEPTGVGVDAGVSEPVETTPPGVVPLWITVCSAKNCRRSSAKSVAVE